MRGEKSTHMAQRDHGRPSQAAACVLFPVLPPCRCPDSCSTSAALTIPATAISPVGPDTSQLFSSPKDKAEEDCLKMTNRIILVLCRAAVGASTAIYKGCGLQKANIPPWPMGSLL